MNNFIWCIDRVSWIVVGLFWQENVEDVQEVEDI